MIQSQSEIIQLPNWNVRYRGPQGTGYHAVILLLHGWTGDENSMWIFASRLPDQAILISPRGL